MIRKPLAPAAIRLSTAATWPSLSPSNLPAKRAQLDAELLGLGLGALPHLDEERIAVGLGDQADDGLVLRDRCSARQQGQSHSAAQQKSLQHLYSSLVVLLGVRGATSFSAAHQAHSGHCSRFRYGRRPGGASGAPVSAELSRSGSNCQENWIPKMRLGSPSGRGQEARPRARRYGLRSSSATKSSTSRPLASRRRAAARLPARGSAASSATGAGSSTCGAAAAGRVRAST